MKQVELRLIPSPGQKPEFLAVVELVQKQNIPRLWQEQLPKMVILEGYTRDAWAMDASTNQWTSWQVESIDGKGKLSGFVKYLRDRKKTCYGRVMVPVINSSPTPSATKINSNNNSNSNKMTMVWVISHKQMSSSTLNCRIAPLDAIPQCPLKPFAVAKPIAQQQQQKPPPVKTAQETTMTTNATSTASNKEEKNGVNRSGTGSTSDTKTKRKGFGLLGNLVGAQKRTNNQMQIAATVVPKSASAPSNVMSEEGSDNKNINIEKSTGDVIGVASSSSNSSNTGDNNVGMAGTKTAGQILADFRQEMEQEMLDFDISTEPCLKIKIDLPGKLRLMTDEEKQTGKISMEILKYIVYEQAEEVNEEWVAHREPSEFMDEVTIAIYKEGEAPDDVLEDVNKAELPDEIRGQQRAIQEQRQKAEQIKAQKLRIEQTKLALQMKQKQKALQQQQQQHAEVDDDDDDDDFAALNTQKRDRRTIEDFEREAKRRRGEE